MTSRVQSAGGEPRQRRLPNLLSLFVCEPRERNSNNSETSGPAPGAPLSPIMLSTGEAQVRTAAAKQTVDLAMRELQWHVNNLGALTATGTRLAGFSHFATCFMLGTPGVKLGFHARVAAEDVAFASVACCVLATCCFVVAVVRSLASTIYGTTFALHAGNGAVEAANRRLGTQFRATAAFFLAGVVALMLALLLLACSSVAYGAGSGTAASWPKAATLALSVCAVTTALLLLPRKDAARYILRAAGAIEVEVEMMAGVGARAGGSDAGECSAAAAAAMGARLVSAAGAVVLKHGRKGTAHRRVLRCDGAAGTLTWASEGESAGTPRAAQSVALGRTELRTDATTEVLRRTGTEQSRNRYLSLVGGRLDGAPTLDLECSSREERDALLEALQALLARPVGVGGVNPGV